jgi:hypothetical protein
VGGGGAVGRFLLERKTKANTPCGIGGSGGGDNFLRFRA